MKPDPKRVEAIAKMAKPANKSELQTILGMENYLSKFAPHPSGVTAPMRDLLKKDSEFMWDMQQETAFTKMKDIVTRSPVLVVDYYSSYPEVEHLPDTRAATVINKIKRILARHGTASTSRRLRSSIPCTINHLRPVVIEPSVIENILERNQTTQQTNYDKSGKDLEPLHSGEHVRLCIAASHITVYSVEPPTANSMTSVATADLEKIINDLEFENQQYVKEITKEKDRVDEITVQLEEHKTNVVRLKQETKQLDEDTKSHHRQFTQNRANVESVRQTLLVLGDHKEALQKKLELLIQKGEEERAEREQILEHYQSQWCDYEKTYKTFSLARQLQQKMEQRQQAAERCRQAASQLETVRIQLNAESATDTRFRPYTDINSFVIKLAEVKVKTLVMQQQSKLQHARCQQLKPQLAVKEQEKREMQEKESERKKRSKEDDKINQQERLKQQHQQQTGVQQQQQQWQHQEQQQLRPQEQQQRQDELLQQQPQRQQKQQQLLEHEKQQQQSQLREQQQQQQQWSQLKRQRQQQQLQLHEQQHLQLKQQQQQHQLLQQQQKPQQHHYLQQHPYQEQQQQLLQQHEHACMLVDNPRTVSLPAGRPYVRHPVRSTSQPRATARFLSVPQVPQLHNINVAMPQRHRHIHGQQVAAVEHQSKLSAVNGAPGIFATATPSEVTLKPTAPSSCSSSSLPLPFSQVHIRPNKHPVSYTVEIPQLELPNAPARHPPTNRWQILQPSTTCDHGHEPMHLTASSPAVRTQAKANTVIQVQAARAQLSASLMSPHRRPPTPHGDHQHHMVGSSIQVQAARAQLSASLLPPHRRPPTPHVVPPQFPCLPTHTPLMANDPSTLVCGEPKTPVRPSTSSGHFNTPTRSSDACGQYSMTTSITAVIPSGTPVSMVLDDNRTTASQVHSYRNWPKVQKKYIQCTCMDENAETVEPTTSPVTTMNATHAEPKGTGRNAVEKHVEQNTNVKQVAATLAAVNTAPRETVTAETSSSSIHRRQYSSQRDSHGRDK
ncbi:hypothetical protein LSAT2_011314 [Lamellibrachia satsuma]|nr:hypothetical protein LSAT2_011314 [Lamellibrachia satsuma]